jgi:ATP-dependent Zn protease
VRGLLTGRREVLEKISRKLLETEVIEAEEFKQLLAA